MLNRKIYIKMTLRLSIILIILFTLLNQNRSNVLSNKTKPNIVIIVIDALRADHLPFYGYEKNTTPFLSDISKKSVIFERAFSVCSWTAPSLASLFTSLYPIQHGLIRRVAPINIKKKTWRAKLNRLPEKTATIAELLKDSGYSTYAVTVNPHLCKELNFDQGFDLFQNYGYAEAAQVSRKLKEWRKTIEASAPYFLFIHYLDPHHPYIIRKPWYKKRHGYWLDLISRYDSEISYVDNQIRKLFDIFGWDANTLLIITSDHGEELNEHGGIGHGTNLYVESIIVPLLFFGPEFGFKSKTIEYNVSLIDVLPTIREFIGSSKSPDDQGISLVSLLKKDRQNLKKRYLFSFLSRFKGEKHLTDEYETTILKKSVIFGDWHYIYNDHGSDELFNFKDDPKEKLNKINETRRIAEKLKSKLSNFEKNAKKFEQEVVEHSFDKEKLETLKSLRYIQ